MKRLVAIALVVASVVVTAAGSSEARANGGGRPASPGHVAAPPAANHGFAGRPAFNGHQGFVNHRGFVGHRGFHRGGHGTVFLGVAPFVVGPAFAYNYDPGYVEAPSVYTPPTVYYYCPSAGGYYPDVPVCSEQWVPVPAQ